MEARKEQDRLGAHETQAIVGENQSSIGASKPLQNNEGFEYARKRFERVTVDDGELSDWHSMDDESENRREASGLRGGGRGPHALAAATDRGADPAGRVEGGVVAEGTCGGGGQERLPKKNNRSPSKGGAKPDIAWEDVVEADGEADRGDSQKFLTPHHGAERVMEREGFVGGVIGFSNSKNRQSWLPTTRPPAGEFTADWPTRFREWEEGTGDEARQWRAKSLPRERERIPVSVPRERGVGDY